jgi:hypothetical protein
MSDCERYPVSMWLQERPNETTLGQYKDWLDEKLDAECIALGIMNPMPDESATP